MDCVFCARIHSGDVEVSNDHAVAFGDAFPLSDGHALIVPRRHESDLFRLTPIERVAVWALLDDVHAIVGDRFKPDGFNIGANVGEPAGQTVGHAHVHLIPRIRGDVDDPRGGIRWVLPDRAVYWEKR